MRTTRRYDIYYSWLASYHSLVSSFCCSCGLVSKKVALYTYRLPCTFTKINYFLFAFIKLSTKSFSSNQFEKIRNISKVIMEKLKSKIYPFLNYFCHVETCDRCTYTIVSLVNVFGFFSGLNNLQKQYLDNVIGWHCLMDSLMTKKCTK